MASDLTTAIMGFGSIFAGLAGYAAWLWLHQAKLAKQIADLEHRAPADSEE